MQVNAQSMTCNTFNRSTKNCRPWLAADAISRRATAALLVSATERRDLRMEPEPEPELLGAAQRLSGLWRAKGKTMRGGSTEEFLQLDVSN